MAGKAGVARGAKVGSGMVGVGVLDFKAEHPEMSTRHNDRRKPIRIGNRLYGMPTISFDNRGIQLSFSNEIEIGVVIAAIGYQS